MRYLYQAQPDLEVVVCRDDAEIVEAIDERTLLVLISHVLFRTGEIQDVEPIVSRAHDAGAHVVLDCYQSAGVVPLDVTAFAVDFAVGGSAGGSAAARGTAGLRSPWIWPTPSRLVPPDGRRTPSRSPSPRR